MLSKFRFWSRNNFSKLVLFLILFYFLGTFFKVGRWEENKIILHDARIYHSYLPAAFIYNDLSLGYRDSLNRHFNNTYVSGYKNDEGRLVQKMTVGKAIMDVPFFLAGHVWAKLDNRYSADGYDTIYHLFIGLSGLFYSFFALIYIRKLLREMVPDYIIGVTILLIGCATNLFYYSTYNSGMAHASGLFLITFFIYHSIRFVDHHHSDP